MRFPTSSVAIDLERIRNALISTELDWSAVKTLVIRWWEEVMTVNGTMFIYVIFLTFILSFSLPFLLFFVTSKVNVSFKKYVYFSMFWMLTLINTNRIGWWQDEDYRYKNSILTWLVVVLCLVFIGLMLILAICCCCPGCYCYTDRFHFYAIFFFHSMTTAIPSRNSFLFDLGKAIGSVEPASVRY